MKFWLNHPRSGEPDAMLTIAVYATLTCLAKFLLNGVTVEILDKTINFGTVDAGLLTALLTPTLLAYVGRKFTDSPDKSTKEIEE